MKQRIRLTESDLHRIINDSVKKVVTEAASITGPGDVPSFNKDMGIDEIIETLAVFKNAFINPDLSGGFKVQLGYNLAYSLIRYFDEMRNPDKF